MMTKREVIEAIRKLNPTAQPEFLAEFSENQLAQYLEQLLHIQGENGCVLAETAVEA